MVAIAETWLPVIGAGICIAWAIGAWYGGNKILAIWLCFFGIVCLLLLGTLQWQNAVKFDNGSKENLQRAFVFPDYGDVVQPLNMPPTVAVDIKNSGKTPAYDLTWRVQFVVAKVEAEKNLALDKVMPNTKQTLGAAEILSYTYAFTNWNPEFDTLLSEEKAAIYCIGQIRYRDIDGIDRWVDYVLKSGGRFGIKSGTAPGRFSVLRIKSN